MDFEYKEQDRRTNPPSKPVVKNTTENYSKHSQTWIPRYVRRQANESFYLGLQDVQTGADNASSYRYRSYRTVELEHEAAGLIRKDLNYVLGKNYDKLNRHAVKGIKQKIWGLEIGGTKYSELSMGAGEKRVLNILSALHHTSFSKGGLLVIDELDAFLHGASFERLIEVIKNKVDSSRSPLQVVFTTHNEAVSKFSDKIDVRSILNSPEKTLSLPYVHPDVMMQLTGESHSPIDIYVEDELAEDIVNRLVFDMNVVEFVSVKLFGAASNAFGVLCGKALLGHDISRTLCVLDGDVFLKRKERESEVKAHLNGNDKDDKRKEILGHVKSLNIFHSLPDGSKRGAPEYNHKILFETSREGSSQIERIKNFSKGIQGLEDWHCYYENLSHSSGVKDCRSFVLNHLSEESSWDYYLRDVKEWIEQKMADVKGISLWHYKGVEFVYKDKAVDFFGVSKS